MRPWILCGAGLLALGVAVTLFKRSVPTPAPSTPTVVEQAAADDVRPEPAVIVTAPAPPSLPPARPWIDESLEPIVTRLEPLQDQQNPPRPLLIDGGAEESEATVPASPRPDRDARRMPYADETVDTWASRFLRWSGLLRIVPTFAARPAALQ